MKFNITKNDNEITISTSKKLHTISDFSNSNVFDIINTIKLTKDDITNLKDSSIAHTTNHLDYFEDTFEDITILTFTSCDVESYDFEGNLRVLNSSKGFENAKIDISNIIYINRALSKKDLFKVFKSINTAKSQLFSNMNLPIHIQNILNTNDFLCVMCNISDEYENLNLNVTESVEIACEKAFKKLDLTCGILDYLVSEAIQIEELVDSAVLIIHSYPDDFKDRLHSQIVKSLEDINVISIIMAALRLDEDIIRSHIREVDFNTPNLTGDKALALTLANQIGGNNAVFEFINYMKYKPGVLGELPAVFTGLVAGCVTNVLVRS